MGYLPRAVDKANHGAKNLHHYRVVVLPVILEYVLEFVRLFTPSQLLFSALLVLIDHDRSAELPSRPIVLTRRLFRRTLWRMMEFASPTINKKDALTADPGGKFLVLLAVAVLMS